MLETVCIPPHTFDTQYIDLYSCQIEGYKKSIEKIEEIGNDKVNEFKIYTTFACKPLESAR